MFEILSGCLLEIFLYTSEVTCLLLFSDHVLSFRNFFQRYGPFSAKMVATFKALLVWQGVIASGTMAKEAHLTADEAAAFLAALRSIPSIRDTLTSADANLYT